MTYAIISVGGKQYRVQEGQRLLVDRLKHDGEGKTFTPTVLLVGGDGETQLSPSGVTVTAKIVGDRKGPKIRIGKYKPKVGYKKHTGFRASLTQIEIESIGGKRKAAAAAKPKAEAAPKAAPAPKAEAAAPAPQEAPSATGALPAGYDDLKVAEIKTQAQGWERPQLEAALAHEQAGANRKGAVAALEAALAAKENG